MSYDFTEVMQRNAERKRKRDEERKEGVVVQTGRVEPLYNPNSRISMLRPSRLPIRATKGGTILKLVTDDEY